jgi:hypothetical protein
MSPPRRSGKKIPPGPKKPTRRRKKASKGRKGRKNPSGRPKPPRRREEE